MQYHRSVDKLFIFVFGPLACAAVLLVIATGIRRAITSFRCRPTPDQLKAAYDSYLRRLLHPQPDAVERERWPVYCFEPLDIESLNELPYEEELGPGFCFATTGRGSWYWIAASDQRANDSPVIFLDYDGGRSHGKTVAGSLEEFLNWPRVPMR
jgi:hypothetical protein